MKLKTKLVWFGILLTLVVAFTGVTTTKAGASTTSSSLSSSPTLKIEDTNPSVLLLQQYLNNNGYVVNEIKGEPGSIGNETTKFGLKTKQALIRFQKDHNITPADGIFGPITKAKTLEVATTLTGDTSGGAVLGATVSRASGSGASTASGSGSLVVVRKLDGVVVTGADSASNPYGLKVTSDPAGIDCGLTCSNRYGVQTQMNLTAEFSDPSVKFDKWRMNNTMIVYGNIFNITIRPTGLPKYVEALYSKKTQHTLTIKPNTGNGSGSITTNPSETFVYNDGDVAHLMGISDSGSTVGTWTFTGSNGNPNYTVIDDVQTPKQVTHANVTIDQDITVSLPFNKEVTLTILPNTGDGTGDITVSDPSAPNVQSFNSGGQTFKYGDVVTLTGTANVGSKVGSWNISGTNGTPSYTVGQILVPDQIAYVDITMTQDINVGLPFNIARNIARYPFTVIKGGTGTGNITFSPYLKPISSNAYQGSFPVGTPVTITATVGKDTTFEATGNGVSCTTSPCIVTSSDVDPAINANLNSTAVYYPPTDAGTTTSTTNTGTSTNINSNTNTSSSSNMTGVGTNTTTNQSTSTNTDTNTLSNTNTSTTTSTPITSTSKKPILALPKTTTVLPSLKIKTTADLNAFIKNVTFFKSTVKNNFITNANVIIKKGQTLNLYFSNIKNTKSLGLYKKAGIAQNTVFGYPMNTVNMYLEDNATASGDNCSRSVLAQSPSIAPRSVVNPTPPTPLLNSMGGICDVLSIGSCLTNTYHLPIPSGWSLPYISPTGLSSNTDASSSSNTYWNNSFLENLIGNSGLLDITDGIDTEQDIDVYNGYMNALSNGGSPLQVSRTDFGGTKSSPSPISSDEQDQLYFLLNHTSNPINPIYSGVDCELESNDHASHINSISFGTDGQLHIGIDNDLAQGSIAPTGYSNIPAPSLQSGTEFTLNNEGRVVGVSGADAEGYWAQSSTYDWFIIHCYTLTSSSSSSTQQTSSTATASTNPGNSTTPNTQNTNSESTDPGLQTQDSSPVTIGSVDPALSTELKTNSTLNTFTNKITFFSSTTKANFLSNANYTIKNGQALDLYFSNTKDKDSIGLNKTTNKYLEDEAVAAGNTCSTLIPALSRWDTKTITLQTPLLNNAKKGICSILATAESIVYTLGLPTPSGWVDPIYTATSTNITVWNTVFWEQMARASGLAPRSKWSYR